MVDNEKRKRLEIFKADEKAVLKILNDCEPIGVTTPKEVYSYLAHRLLSALYRGEETEESISILVSYELKYSYGISASEHKVNAISNKIIKWWLSKKTNKQSQNNKASNC